MSIRKPLLKNLTKNELIEYIETCLTDHCDLGLVDFIVQKEREKNQAERDRVLKLLDDTMADFSEETHAKRMRAHHDFDDAMAMAREIDRYRERWYDEFLVEALK